MKTETLSPPPPTHAEAFKRLCDLIEDINIAMLTTISAEGMLRSRPMGTQQVDVAGGALWFFTTDTSPKVEEIVEDQHVNLTYASPKKHNYVSVSGRARIIRDKTKARELWTPLAKIWFPDGVDDPGLVLLRVEVEAAEYWDSPSTKMVQFFDTAKSALTGTASAKLGENVKVEMPGSRPPW